MGEDKDSLLAAVIEASLECVVVIDEGGHVVEWNPASEAAFGYSRSEAVGREIADLIIPERHKAAHAHGFARYLAGGKAHVLGRRVEIEGRRKDGSEIPIELAINEVRRGERRLFTASLRDLTEKLSTQAELRRVQALITGFFENVPAAMYLKDTNGVFELSNRAANALWNAQEGSAIGRVSYDLIDEPGASIARAQDRLVLDSGRAQSVEQVFARGGKTRHALTTRFPIRNLDGDITHIGAILIDISERVRTEIELKESRATLLAFLENAPVGMCIKGSDGRYEYMNPFAADLFGLTPEEMVGRLPSDVIAGAEGPLVDSNDREVLASGETMIDERRYRSVAGREFTALTARFRLPDADGAPNRTATMLVDVTAQRRAEQELLDSRARLQQAEKVSALGSLLAGVSHELNNPLSVIVGEAILLGDEAAETSFAKRAGRIQRAAERCSRIVQTFLAMARQKQPELVRSDFNAIVQAALDLTGYAMSSNGIAVAAKLAPGLPSVRADADLLHQVVVNLLVNAQQALADRRGGAIAVETFVDHDAVCLRVRDNGPGIDGEVAARIFEPFFTTKTQGTGTGIGLSFSLGVVEAHGGSLVLEPAAGGASFLLSLPAASGSPAIVSEIAAEMLTGARGRALVIDDEPDFAEMLADFLVREGYEVELARDGREGVARLEKASFDLILSDLRMPEVDGADLHSWLAANRPELVARLGYITGDTLAPHSDRFLIESGRPFATKPFTAQSLRQLIAQVTRSA